MKSKLKTMIIATSCSTALFFVACHSGSQGDENPVIETQYYLSEMPYRAGQLDQAKAINIMTYRMPNVLGKMVNATALVMIPQTPPPKDGWRVVLWQHDSVGVADQCAPSVNPLDSNFSSLAKSLLNAGYVIVAPDYEGLGVAGIHPYLNLASEAQSGLAALKAVKQHYAQQLNGAWMSIGQSQGGQASLAIAEYANADPAYKGTVAVAPVSGMAEIILDVAPKLLNELEKTEIANQVALEQRESISAYARLLSYAALTGVGIKAYDPHFDYQALFQQRAQPIAALAEGTTGENGLCLQSADPEQSLWQNFHKDIIQFMQRNPDLHLLDYPGINVQAVQTNHTLNQFFMANEPATKHLDKPVLIAQGEADMDVPHQVTEALVERLKSNLNTSVLFIEVADADHADAMIKVKPTLLNFIQRNMPAR